MKKIFLFLIVSVLLFSLCACKKESSVSDKKIETTIQPATAISENATVPYEELFSDEEDSDSPFKSFYVDEKYILIGEKAHIKFKAILLDDFKNDENEIKIVDENKNTIGKMIKSEEMENSYEFETDLFSETKQTIKFYADLNGELSNEVEIIFYNSEEDKDFYAQDIIFKELSEISDPYADENGIIKSSDFDKFKEATEKYLNEQVKNKTIKNYDYSSNQIVITTNDNNEFVFAYFIEGLN